MIDLQFSCDLSYVFDLVFISCRHKSIVAKVITILITYEPQISHDIEPQSIFGRLHFLKERKQTYQITTLMCALLCVVRLPSNFEKVICLNLM
jgi:hypothetical protein